MSSEVLSANSDVFAGLIAQKSPGLTCRMEVSDVENLGVFKETVELMFEESNGIIKKLMKMGVYRAIDVLEVWKTVLPSSFWLLELDGFCCCYYICLTCLILVIYICLPVEKHCIFALDSNLTHLWLNP